MATVIHRQKRKVSQEEEVLLPVQQEAQKSLTELASLVDEGYGIDQTIKAKEVRLKEIKETILREAKERKLKVIKGTEKRYVDVGDSKSSFIPVDAFRKLLTKIGKPKLFDVLVKVGITDAKKTLGELALKPIIKEETKEYNSCSFKLEK